MHLQSPHFTSFRYISHEIALLYLRILRFILQRFFPTVNSWYTYVGHIQCTFALFLTSAMLKFHIKIVTMCITLTVYRKCTPTITEKKDWRKSIFGKRNCTLPKQKRSPQSKRIKKMTPFHHVWSFKRRTGLLWSLNCKEELSVVYTSQGEWGYFGAEHRFITPSWYSDIFWCG